MLEPLVSVGIPTYNRPEGLEVTIQYLLKQDYKNLEIIISDNCSTNSEVLVILKKYASLDPRITYYIQATNIEGEPNFNFVYNKAKGKYFMWLADDDVFISDYITKCVNFLEANSDYLLCSGSCEYYKDDKFYLLEKNTSIESNNRYLRMFKYFKNVSKNGLFYGLYRNNLQFKAPIKKHLGADWCHISRIAFLGKIHILPNVINKRSDDGGSSSRGKMIKRWELNKLQTKFFETYMAFQISRNIFKEPVCNSLISPIIKYPLELFIFVGLNFKFLFNSICRRIK